MTTTGSGEHLLPALRTEALEQLLTERGLIDPKVMNGIITEYETNVGPLNGAKVVAKAWADPEYRRRLLEDGTAAIKELGTNLIASWTRWEDAASSLPRRSMVNIDLPTYCNRTSSCMPASGWPGEDASSCGPSQSCFSYSALP